MVYFNSTAVRGAKYDASRRMLTLVFTSSSDPYDYPNVPQQIYDGLLAARSKGTYYNLYIRDQYSVNR